MISACSTSLSHCFKGKVDGGELCYKMCFESPNGSLGMVAAVESGGCQLVVNFFVTPYTFSTFSMLRCLTVVVVVGGRQL